LTNSKGGSYDLEIPNAEMFRIPFLGRFLQLAQYMYYVYGIKLTITSGVRSYEEQQNIHGITQGVSISPHMIGLAIDVNMEVVYKNGNISIDAKNNLLHFLWMLL